MARNFRRQRTAQPIADLNVTNLIDLGFMLLIIFMIATPLITQREQTTRINLPEIARLPESKPDKETRYIAISVDATGRYFLENSATPVTLPELRTRLRGYAAEAKQPVMRIRGDGEARHKMMLTLVGELTQAGLTRVQFDSLAK